MDEHALQAVLDKQEITEVLARYLRGVDRGDVEAVRSCYLPGATEDHGGVYAGPADAYVDSIVGAITEPRAKTSHCMTNVLIDVDGDRAVAECYVTTYAKVRSTEGTRLHTVVGARMIDRFERRDGRWGIAHRQLLWEWNQDAVADQGWLGGQLVADPSVLTRGGKRPTDPLYVALDELRQPAAPAASPVA